MDLIQIGASIREARKAAKRSQAQLAQSLGMSRATISAIENGTVPDIGIRKLDALCATLGLDLYVGPKRSRPTLQELREEQRATRKQP